MIDATERRLLADVYEAERELDRAMRSPADEPGEPCGEWIRNARHWLDSAERRLVSYERARARRGR